MNGQHGKSLAYRVAALLTILAADVLVLRDPIARLIASALPSGRTTEAASLAEAAAPCLGAALAVGGLFWLLSAYDALIVASAIRRGGALTGRSAAR